MGEIIKVGMADLKVCKAPDGLTTLGLGSCIGVVIYDPSSGVCGMLHCMLPDSKAIKNNENIYKFADTGMDELLRLVLAQGAARSKLVAKMAGGAQMFSFGSAPTDFNNIGARNAEAVAAKLKEFNIRLLARETGGNKGRTIIFDPATYMLTIKAVGVPVHEI